MDWKDLTHSGELRAYLISPNNLDIIEKQLTGIDWPASKLSAAYYSDTRTSGSLTVIGDGWNHDDPHTPRVRIVYEIPEKNYFRELGTYIVRNDPQSMQAGKLITELELQSPLYALSLDIPATKKALAPGSLISTAIRSELQAAGFEYDLSEINEYVIGTLTILEAGKSRLARLFSLAGLSNNRLEVDPHGRIKVTRYVEPDNKTATARIELGDDRGIVYDGIKRASNYLQQPSEATVQYHWTENENGESVEHEITATATVSASSYASRANRGYTITDYTSLNEMTPPTYERARQLAEEKLVSASKQKTEWTIRTKYLPLWEGDVIELVIPYGDRQYRGSRKCLVKNIELETPYMDMELTLKETSGGDTE